MMDIPWTAPPVVIALVVALVALGTLVFKVGGWASRVDADRREFREAVKDLRVLMGQVLDELKGVRVGIEDIRGGIREILVGIQDIRGGIEDIRGGIRDIRGDIQDIRGGIQDIRGDLKEVLFRLPSGASADSSPLHLTEKGLKMSGEMQAKEWAESKAQEFVDGLRGKKPYEIHDFCSRYVTDEFRPDEDWTARIGMCAYENGMERDKVLIVLIIELRDALLRMLGESVPAPRKRTADM